MMYAGHEKPRRTLLSSRLARDAEHERYHPELEEEIKERIKKAQDAMESRQLALKEHGLPVIVLLEGWGAAGKGATATCSPGRKSSGSTPS